MTGKGITKRALRLEPLEFRLCMSASVGWDGPGQADASLTYYIGNLPASVTLSRAEVAGALESALDAWAEAADITFTETQWPNQPDSIDFTFRSMDGLNGTLALAYFPDDVNPARIAGDIQFDTAERWEVGDRLGSAAFDLALLAVHEVGHALGLDHSDVSGLVMAESVSPNQTFGGLAPADVDAILALYAAADSDLIAGPTDSQDDADSDPDSDSTDDDGLIPRWSHPWSRGLDPFCGFRRPRAFTRSGRFGSYQSPAWNVSMAGKSRSPHHGNDAAELDNSRSSWNEVRPWNG